MSSDERSGRERVARRALQTFRAADIPVVSDVHATWARFTDPAAKLERRRRRSSRAMTLWLVLTMLCGLFAVTGFYGLTSGDGGWSAVITELVGVVAFGTLSVRSGLRLRRLGRTRLPVSSSPPPLPPSGSRAREPMRRLAESEASLAELLRQLDDPTSNGSGPSPEMPMSDARSTADDAAAALRGLAARIQAIERARRNSPNTEQAALDSAIDSLAEQLDDGVEGYGSLVAAAGRVVAASSTGATPAKETLTEATDHLAGLAIALRELS